MYKIVGISSREFKNDDNRIFVRRIDFFKKRSNLRSRIRYRNRFARVRDKDR